VQLEGLGQLKSPMASSGNEPATFRLLTELSALQQKRLKLVLLPLKMIFSHVDVFSLTPLCREFRV
jgi:hypothetical protein